MSPLPALSSFHLHRHDIFATSDATLQTSVTDIKCGTYLLPVTIFFDSLWSADSFPYTARCPGIIVNFILHER